MPSRSRTPLKSPRLRTRYDRWLKNMVVYCLDVETYLDSHGDGIGDFAGLTKRMDYLANLGIDCLWLMPFYPTANLDDGYDITDFYGVDSKFGDLGDLGYALRAGHHQGIRVMANLVINHTSRDHPWFQDARGGTWLQVSRLLRVARRAADDWKTQLVFSGKQIENWTYDRKAGRFYLHHFYDHQPDFNLHNPAIREEIEEILSFWVELVSRDSG